MPDDNTPAADPNGTQPAAGGAASNPVVAPAGSSAPDTTKMAEDLGRLKAENEVLKGRIQSVDPVLETINSDPDLYQTVLDRHNKRTGVTPADDKPKTDDKIETAKPSPDLVDTRNSQIKMIVDDFSRDKGIDKMSDDEKKDINQKVGAMLGEMLDPMGNKTLQQILETVSLTKLPKFLENAYFLATKDKTIEDARAQGKQSASDEGRAMIGSMPSSSSDVEAMTLTTEQRKAADKMGISADKYLQRLKEIAKRDNNLA